MRQLSYWHSVEVSAGARPTLREKEIDILVEDSVGLYQGKSKILERQDGRVYLTSQRLIYVDNASPRDMSLALELTDVKYVDYTPKFLRSSPKITVFFKKIKKNASANQSIPKPSTTRTTTWICPICTYSNNVSIHTNYESTKHLPACETCGVKAESETIRLAIEAAKSSLEENPQPLSKKKQIECAACTFLNHPSMRNCEICGTVLPLNAVNELSSDTQEIFDDRIKIVTEVDDGLSDVDTPFIKISFHKGGDKVFHERLEQTLEKLEWESLMKRGNVNMNATSSSEPEVRPSSSSMALGLHKLSLMDADQTRKNEEIINSSLDDLQTLLAKAHEIQNLIESFKKLQTGDERQQARIIPTINQVTQDVLSDPSKERQKKLYIQEISRQISEFLINGGTLDQEGGIITLMDLYALYNRGRVGLNLITPEQLYEACENFKFLKLPLVLKKINKVLVVQDKKFENVEQLVDQLEKFIEIYGVEDQFQYKHCSILRVSEFFNWSLTITEEVLKLGVEAGALCVDQQITGKHYYLNEFLVKNEVAAVVEDDNNKGLDQLLQTSAPSTLLPTLFPEVPTGMQETDNKPKVKSTSMMELEGLQF